MKFENSFCKDCHSKTKLLIKSDKGMCWWCSIAKDCPYSKPKEASK